MIIDSTGIGSFKFNVPKQINGLNIRIEGISDDGMIFLENRSVSSN
jgi:hypothetical protein